MVKHELEVLGVGDSWRNWVWRDLGGLCSGGLGASIFTTVSSGRFAATAARSRRSSVRFNVEKNDVFLERDVTDCCVRWKDVPRAAVVDVEAAADVILAIGDESQ